jgi:hypothetical protein
MFSENIFMLKKIILLIFSTEKQNVWQLKAWFLEKTPIDAH